MLKATSAENIEKIELINKPPSKYDAEGDAGYINIILIKNHYAGFNGSSFFQRVLAKKQGYIPKNRGYLHKLFDTT
ncbi:MAG: hypothetical protein ABI691_21735 [Ginsengibacter sp.]